MFRLHVDAKRTKTAIIGSTKAMLWNMLCGGDQRLTDFLGGLKRGMEGIGNSDKDNLVIAGILSTEFVDLFLIGLTGALDKEVTCVELEEAREALKR